MESLRCLLCFFKKYLSYVLSYQTCQVSQSQLTGGFRLSYESVIVDLVNIRRISKYALAICSGTLDPFRLRGGLVQLLCRCMIE